VASAFPPLNPEYDAFLYAVVCREENGMQLTTASAIARSGADPWKEAARLSRLPKDAAIQALTRLMPDQACADKDSPDAQITADRLFSLLPKRTHAPIINTVSLPRTKVAIPGFAFALCVGVLVIALMVIALRPHAENHAGGAAVPTPVEGVQ
jgi:hypothetical protein